MKPFDSALVEKAKRELDSMRKGPWHSPGKWSISSYNFGEAISRRLAGVPKKITISEMTPRILEQMPGVFLSTSDRIAILEQLAAMAIPEVHVGFLPYKSPLLEEVRVVAKQNFPFELVAVVHTVEQAAILAAAGVHAFEVVTFPRPSLQLAVVEQSTDSIESYIAQAAAKLEGMARLGVRVRAALTDAGIADPEYVRLFSQAAASLNLDSIYIADSGGSLGPHGVTEVIRLVRSVAPKMKLGLHLHNDFGLAMSSALAGLEAGVEVFDTTVDGLGEKGGQLNLGTFVLACEAFYGVSTGVRLEGLRKLSQLATKACGVSVPCYMPLTGEDAFSATLEHHRRVQDEVDPFILATISPSVVGGSKHNLLGIHSGQYSLLREANALGFHLTDRQLNDAHQQLVNWLRENGRRITSAEIKNLLMHVVSEWGGAMPA